MLGTDGRYYKEKTCLVTVDGADFPVWEPRVTKEARAYLEAQGKVKHGARYKPKDTRYYSPKLKRAGLRYELAVCIRTGDIVWIAGPYACGEWDDLSIFRHKLKQMLLPGEMVEADDGYKCQGEPIRIAKEYVSEVDQLAKSRARNRHEHVNGLFKDFGCCRQIWRHYKEDHALATGAVATLIQISFDEGQEPWQVRY